jgi:hypothetical protein
MDAIISKMKRSNEIKSLCRFVILIFMFLLTLIVFSACIPEEFFDHDNLSTKTERLILNTLLLILNVIFILSLWKLAVAIDAKKTKLLVIFSIVIPYLNFLVACYLVLVVFNGTRNKRFPD